MAEERHPLPRAYAEQEKTRHLKTPLAEQLIEIAKRCAANVGGKVSSGDHAGMLYDSQGLPR